MADETPYRAAPRAEDRSILVVALNGQVVGVDRQTGEIRWKQGTDGGSGGIGEVFVAMSHGLLLVSGHDAMLVSLDYATGAIKWRGHTYSTGRATILVERDVIVCAKGGYLDCFGHGGMKLWTQPLSGLGQGRVTLGFPGNVAQADSHR